MGKVNKEFEAASPAEKRIMIAKDAIEQIEAGQYIARQGVYLQNDDEDGKNWINSGTKSLYGVDLQKWLEDSDNKCRVCAKGAIFASCIRYTDDYSPETEIIKITRSTVGAHKEIDRLAEYFREGQLELIEIAFEGDIIGSRTISFAEIESAKDFYLGYGSDMKRLKAILDNIIDNGGEFIP